MGVKRIKYLSIDFIKALFGSVFRIPLFYNSKYYSENYLSNSVVVLTIVRISAPSEV